MFYIFLLVSRVVNYLKIKIDLYIFFFEHFYFLPSRHPKMHVVTEEDLIMIDTHLPSSHLNMICATKNAFENIEKKSVPIRYSQEKNTGVEKKENRILTFIKMFF